MVQDIAIVVLATMVVIQKYQTDKEIKRLKHCIQIQNKVNAELANSTKELLNLSNIMLWHLIVPISRHIGLNLWPPKKPKE